ncbi:MAG: YibE/F family protein [Candidatus Limnocylindria bacterium]
MLRRLVPLVAVAVLAGCGNPNTGVGIEVIEGHVAQVIESGDRDGAKFQRLAVELDASLYRGEVVEVQWGGRRALNENGFLGRGDRVLLTLTRDGNTRTYTIAEVVRLPSLWPFVALLALALVAVGRWKGIASLAGLGASIAVFLLAIVPAVRNGDDPLLATLIGSVGVLTVAVFVVHGFNRKSVSALLGTLGALVLVVALAAVAVSVARITGLGTEEAIFVFVGTGGNVDMPRLVLAGVVVGSLGALVDMAVGQASTVFELSATSELRGRRLYLSALNVGRDHIGSLVNTLALAYFGGALPLIVLVSLGFQPLSVSINSEEITESVMAVLVASIGLVLCVPLTTAIAVALADRATRGSARPTPSHAPRDPRQRK